MLSADPETLPQLRWSILDNKIWKKKFEGWFWNPEKLFIIHKNISVELKYYAWTPGCGPESLLIVWMSWNVLEC